MKTFCEVIIKRERLFTTELRNINISDIISVVLFILFIICIYNSNKFNFSTMGRLTFAMPPTEWLIIGIIIKIIYICEIYILKTFQFVLCFLIHF